MDWPSFPIQEERTYNDNHVEKECRTCSVGQVVEIDDGTGITNQDVKSSSGEIPTLGSAPVVLDDER
jgi:hypothetical protein